MTVVTIICHLLEVSLLPSKPVKSKQNKILSQRRQFLTFTVVGWTNLALGESFFMAPSKPQSHLCATGYLLNIFKYVRNQSKSSSRRMVVPSK